MIHWNLAALLSVGERLTEPNDCVKTGEPVSDAALAPEGCPVTGGSLCRAFDTVRADKKPSVNPVLRHSLNADYPPAVSEPASVQRRERGE